MEIRHLMFVMFVRHCAGRSLISTSSPSLTAADALCLQLSTYPLPLGGYYEDQGTSMSCPALVGCIALLLQDRPGALVSQSSQALE